MRQCPRRVWRCVWILPLLVLAACAHVQSISVDAPGTFARTGRFSLTVQAPDAPAQATQGGFAWADDDHTLRVNLSNPVGTVLAQLRVDAARALLARSDGSQEQAANPDALLLRVLGRAVPVAGLRAWLQGRVEARAQDVERDAAGRVARFSQDGWQVQFARFDAQGPRLLRLNRQEAGGERVQLRLVIDGE